MKLNFSPHQPQKAGLKASKVYIVSSTNPFNHAGGAAT